MSLKTMHQGVYGTKLEDIYLEYNKTPFNKPIVSSVKFKNKEEFRKWNFIQADDRFGFFDEK